MRKIRAAILLAGSLAMAAAANAQPPTTPDNPPALQIVGAGGNRPRLVLFTNCTNTAIKDLHSGLKTKVPTLSKTTLYSTLELFARHGLVQGSHTGFPPHHKRDHHVRKDDHVADGHHRQTFCFGFFL